VYIHTHTILTLSEHLKPAMPEAHRPSQFSHMIHCISLVAEGRLRWVLTLLEGRDLRNMFL
jgi:hypothetical protein